MNDQTLWIVAGLAALLILKNKPGATSTSSTQSDYERPQWGANWISNQWAVIQQGTLAHTGQIKPGGYL